MIKRACRLPKTDSFFLLGPRQTGKTTLIFERWSDTPMWAVDLNNIENYLKYSKNPEIFRKEAAEKIKNEKVQTIFIDEVQRIPLLLNEVQSLMFDFSCQFILTGSSARKLKRGGANLLAGRAVNRSLFPFVYQEIKETFDLEEVLRYGTLPSVYGLEPQRKKEILMAYVQNYLREEIKEEAIVRNIGNFSRFLDVAASQSGEVLSFSSISRECEVAYKTVQSYYEILEETLIGFRLEPWRKSLRKRLTAKPKFYLFDLGVINSINKTLEASSTPVMRGRLFEHFIILETYRIQQYRQSETQLYYWQTKDQAEVDLLLERHGKIIGAFEIKSGKNISKTELSGLRSFLEDHPDVPGYIIADVKESYRLDSIQVLPWKEYLEKLDKFFD